MSWLRLTDTSPTASCIHIRHIQSIWEHWYAVHRNKVAAIHSYTHTTCLIFWGSGLLLKSKWCHYVMVVPESHLNLLPVSILDIYKMGLIILICCPWANGCSLKQLHPHYLAHILGFWVTCGVKICYYVMVEADSQLKLLPASTLDIWKLFEHIHMLFIGMRQLP